MVAVAFLEAEIPEAVAVVLQAEKVGLAMALVAPVAVVLVVAVALPVAAAAVLQVEVVDLAVEAVAPVAAVRPVAVVKSRINILNR